MDLERIKLLRVQMITVFASLELAHERYDREGLKIATYERKYFELAAEIEACYEADSDSKAEAIETPAD